VGAEGPSPPKKRRGEGTLAENGSAGAWHPVYPAASGLTRWRDIPWAVVWEGNPFVLLLFIQRFGGRHRPRGYSGQRPRRR